MPTSRATCMYILRMNVSISYVVEILAVLDTPPSHTTTEVKQSRCDPSCDAHSAVFAKLAKNLCSVSKVHVFIPF